MVIKCNKTVRTLTEVQAELGSNTLCCRSEGF